MEERVEYHAEPTMAAFHGSDAFVRGVRGPIGTGKSVGMCCEILAKAIQQKPHNGTRRSRWAAIRNTYPELKSTTINTWLDWVPESCNKMTWDAPITSFVRIPLEDGTIIELEIMFLSLDRPADVKKLKSLDLTGAWLNEASELAKAVLDMATGRVGRYPSKKDGGPSWSGVIMDTNSPDDDHWYYALAENPTPEMLAQWADLVRQLVDLQLMRAGQKLYEFFAQPAALLKDGNRYVPNPDAENVQNQALGYGYWLRQVAGKNEEWIKVFLLGQYGSVHDGKPVYPEYNDALHCKEINPIRGRKLLIGMDFGLTPAAIIGQTDTRGRLLIIDELCGQDMSIRTFLTDILIPQLKQVYPEWYDDRAKMIMCIGDPAGVQRAQSDETSCFEEVLHAGLKIRPAETNSFLSRRGAVVWYLSKLSNGEPAFLMDPCCTMLRKGFNGGYKYRRIQVVGEERFTQEPLKNQYSHPHDALQYLALESGGIQAVKRSQTQDALKQQEFRQVVVGMGPL